MSLDKQKFVEKTLKNVHNYSLHCEGIYNCFNFCFTLQRFM